MREFEAKLVSKIVRHPGDNYINILAGEKRNETYLHVYFSLPIIGETEEEKRILVRKMKIVKKESFSIDPQKKKIQEIELIDLLTKKFYFDFLFFARWDKEWDRAYQYLAVPSDDLINRKKKAVLLYQFKHQWYYRSSEDHLLFFPRATYCPDELFDEAERWLYQCEGIDRPIVSSPPFRHFIRKFIERCTDIGEHADIDWVLANIESEPNDWILFTLAFIGLKNRILHFLERHWDEDFRIAIQIRKTLFSERKKHVQSENDRRNRTA